MAKNSKEHTKYKSRNVNDPLCPIPNLDYEYQELPVVFVFKNY